MNEIIDYIKIYLVYLDLFTKYNLKILYLMFVSFYFIVIQVLLSKYFVPESLRVEKVG